MIYKFLPLLLLFFVSFAPKSTNNTDPKLLANTKSANLAVRIEMIYNSLDANSFALPQVECFKRAMTGFYALKQKGVIEKDILTVIDFSMSSTKKRMWIIDLVSNKILYNTVVSHGRNSGLEYATSFSNQSNSYKSSLGFYTTGETYFGKHGLSLKLDGQEKGINDNARARAVVIHGASYANPSILKNQGYLGRSQGCPAIPEDLKSEIINTIKGKSCLFIYHPAKSYDIVSKLVS
ncbi:murein L,D-transpeptidase catalytic domain family protein [Flavobacterium luminosum]|uniref:Murein L,D-transpeptidase catalytic domain family protein n=1 Tax=Flavobacterium luminosum TaxID=2949086 RepID=A0ABT0TKJ7_9FLAO|nr:murein L,D-transpeptidase catalytic domain family protein [Flavobacterium sp. HXWNR70]MCL9808029.1 murein L,D-transpeptidase catalytic domain family protein [Flavobacterium sp. HXWNR70]